jgi:hypothetical protein
VTNAISQILLILVLISGLVSFTAVAQDEDSQETEILDEVPAADAPATVPEIVVPAAQPPAAPPAQPPAHACCRICTIGKACGNSCIAARLTCHQPAGCACNGEGPPIWATVQLWIASLFDREPVEEADVDEGEPCETVMADIFDAGQAARGSPRARA